MGLKPKDILHELVLIIMSVGLALKVFDVDILPTVVSMAERWEEHTPNLVLAIDRRGQVVPNLPFRIRSEATGAEATHVTNADGIAAISPLAAGQFTVSLLSPGGGIATTIFHRASDDPSIIVVRVMEAQPAARPPANVPKPVPRPVVRAIVHSKG